jgi:signal transduction histidine kinase
VEDVIASTPRSTAVAVLRFAVGGLVALVVLAIGAIVVLRDTAREEAIRDARETTHLMATAAFSPVLDDTVLDSDPAVIARLDEVRARLERADLARVKLWDADGTIVYSDEHRLLAMRFELESDELAILRDGGSEAGVSDLADPENQFEPSKQSLLEVYTKVTTENGTPLLLEAYFQDRDVAESAGLISQRFIPVVVGALVVFALVQVPLGVALARRMRSAQRERERLLQQAIESENNERRRIAADLHDGVVQDLAGVSYTIDAAADALRDPALAAQVAQSLNDAARSTRRGIQQLRTLLVDIYPPNLREAGLPAALRDLLAPLANNGVETSLDCPDDIDLTDHEDALIYRFAREGCRNALRHAQASHVGLSLTLANETITITVCDDGRGFDPAVALPAGHFGLRGLEDVAASSNATLNIDSASGRGTTLRLEIGASR